MFRTVSRKISSQMSRNSYNPVWTATRTLRRLKNVICVMEWQPSIEGDSKSAEASKPNIVAAKLLHNGMLNIFRPIKF